MPTSIIDADSVLAIDVGTISTRAMLFDVVDGRYRYIASGNASTTENAPYLNISEGVRRALDNLEKLSGRVFIGADEKLIMPTTSDGKGIDTFIATTSVGPPLKIIVMGLLEDVSVESARHLALTTYGKIEQIISLNDRRKPDTRIDAILRIQPDLIIMAGGTENGASKSTLKLVQSIRLACSLIPREQRPEVVYAGNQAVKDEILANMQDITKVHSVPNIRPSIDTEELNPAQTHVAQVMCSIRRREIPGLDELNLWSKGNLTPTATAFDRSIRYLSEAHPSDKGVLGIDIGASATTISATFQKKHIFNIFPHLGLGIELAELLNHITLKDITRWLPLDISDEHVQEYLLNKSLSPASISISEEELAIEHAITRQLIQTALKEATSGIPPSVISPRRNLLPSFEPIVATGSVLAKAPTLAHSALILLDGLQPTGATTLVLDQNQIIMALGAAAITNPLLTVQVLDSNSFMHLATVISPVGYSHQGTTIMNVKISYENGQESRVDVKQGSLETLHLPYGQIARLHLQPLHGYDVGMGEPGRGGTLKVVGSALGVIIDARGRPFKFSDDRSRRGELIHKWLWSLGGQ